MTGRSTPPLMGGRGRVVVAGLLALAFAALAVGSASSAPRSHPCPSLDRAAALPRWQGRSPVDAQLASIHYRGPSGIRYAPGARASCGFVLVVERGSRSLAVRVPESDDKGDWPIVGGTDGWPYGDPDLVLVVRLGGSVLYVVGRSHGATTVSVSFYRVTGGRLALVPFRGGSEPATEWGLYGGASASSMIRCAPHGELATLQSWPTGKAGRYGFTATRWRIAPDGFRLVASHNTVGSANVIFAAERQTGFGGPAFGDCTRVRS